MDIKQVNALDEKLTKWNDLMYSKYPTPYAGLAGIIAKARAKTIFKYANIKPESTVLEIGCEGGNLLINAPQAGRLVGADISKSALEDASKLFNNQNRTAEFILLDDQIPLPFQQGEFDIIICSEMLEHVHDPFAVLKNIYEISTNETKVIVTVPLERFNILIKKIFNSIGLLKHLLPDFSENQCEWHLQFFSKSRLLNLCKNLYFVEKSKIVFANHFVTLLRREK